MTDKTWMYAEMPALILKNKSWLMRLLKAGNRLVNKMKPMKFS